MSPREAYHRNLAHRQTIVFGTILSFMGIALVLGLLFWRGVIPFPFDREFTANPNDSVMVPCVDPSAERVTASGINVSVYNATTTPGLARDVSTTLESAGYAITETGNWSGERFSDYATILTGPNGVSAAYSTRAYFSNSSVRFDPTLTGSNILVVMGAGEGTIVAEPTEEQITLAMTPIEGCQPVPEQN